jgi:hypothetical protein
MTISSTGNRCRNCGETERLSDLGFVGQVAPFFLKRVFGIKLGTVRSPNRWKQMIRHIIRLPQSFLDRINHPTTLVEIQFCGACSFVQTKLPFHEDAINRLYLDYREDSYNHERIELEPSYAAMAADVGHGAIELETRIEAATKFISTHVPASENFTILDFGGADGKFMPRIEAKKFVFEISNVQPIAGVTRLHSDAELGTYSLVQLAHVVEHVIEPLELVKYVSAKVAPGGYLYVETPQELSIAEREELKQGRRMVGIHEHINSYCVEAVTKLIENAGLRMVAVEAMPVDVGWATSVHIRALGQKT